MKMQAMEQENIFGTHTTVKKTYSKYKEVPLTSKDINPVEK